MLKAIFWDNDGVLVDTERLYFRATQEIFATAGIEFTEEMYIDLILVHAKGTHHLLAEKGLPPEEIERLRRVRNKRYMQYLATENLLIDGVEKTLQKLHGKYIMGIVTSSSHEYFDLIHNRLTLKHYFNFILTSENYTNYKPDPEPYLAALRAAGCTRDECVVIEDSPRGLAAALGAGLRCIIVPRDLTRSGDFTGAWAVFDDITEIIPALSAIAA